MTKVGQTYSLPSHACILIRMIQFSFVTGSVIKELIHQVVLIKQPKLHDKITNSNDCVSEKLTENQRGKQLSCTNNQPITEPHSSFFFFFLKKLFPFKIINYHLYSFLMQHLTEKCKKKKKGLNLIMYRSSQEADYYMPSTDDLSIFKYKTVKSKQ